MTKPESLLINGRRYAYPTEPVVVVCIDGSEPDYHERAIADGRMPFLASILGSGSNRRANSAMPSFTNPNNLSIATGTPPAVHGICGNYFYDSERDAEVMMNDPVFLRAPTIFAAFADVSADVVVVTAKEKLRGLLGHGLKSGCCFSAEKADAATPEENGIGDVLELVGKPLPSVYSAELSEFVMAAGVALLETRRPLLTYLSLTDYVQHKYAPGTPEANDFYAMLDSYFGRLDELGAVLVITGDHGMNAKSAEDGTTNVVYLQDHLDGWLGAGRSRVILPITDPYTVHHGALGSFAFVYVGGEDIDRVAHQLGELPGVDEVLEKERACAEFELPPDRSGDLAVLGTRDTALGTSADRHDLSQLDRPLRSHGGRTEQQVPFLANRPLPAQPGGHGLRNFDAFAVATELATRA